MSVHRQRQMRLLVICSPPSSQAAAAKKRSIKTPQLPKRKRKWTKGYGIKGCRKVVIDGANVCWAYGRAKEDEVAKAEAERRRVENRDEDQRDSTKAYPDVEGLRVALACPVWESLGVVPIVFLPTTCMQYKNWDQYECSVEKDTLFESHRLVCVENGCITDQQFGCHIKGALSEGNGKGLQASQKRTHLRHKVQRAQAGRSNKSGRGRASGALQRGSSIKSRDDILLLRFAQKNNAWVLSNDKFR